MDLSSFVRRDISGIRKDILPLSGFGILSHALADEIAARNQTREGYFYTTDMEFLEETEPEQPPVLPPRPRQPETIRMDMTLLFKIVQENQESGKALPAGTQRLLERVRTILRTAPQSRTVSAPQEVRRVYVPLPQSAPSTQNTRLTPMVSRQGTPQYLPQNRMQNPLRDPKAPLAVEKMQMPSREVPRASDHAMLFSDVLHRAQESGLTFATRKGQGGIPASAQTRTAYTTQALRQAKAEQQAAEEQSIPVWQRTMLKEASQTSTDVSGASWRFDETGITQQKINESTIDDALGTEKLTSTLPAQKMPENTVSVLQQMAAPRYPEAELNFVQEETPTEGAEAPILTAQHSGAESIRAVQEASAKALTESVRSALKEAAPLMTATVQETVQKQAEQAIRASQQKMKQSASPADAKAQKANTAQGRTTPQMHQTTQPMHQQENAQQTRQAAPAVPQRENAQQAQQVIPNIPPQSNTSVENRVGKTANAANRDTASASVPGKAQAKHAESKRTTTLRNAENISTENVTTNAVKTAEREQMQGSAVENHALHETLEKALPTEQKETSAILMHETAEHPEAEQKQTTDFAEHKIAPRKTVETPVQKSVEQSQLNPKRLAEIAGNEESFQIPEQITKQTQEIIPERIPALNGDRAFAETPENAASILQQMSAFSYPEAELNFVQEEAPMEGAEMPAPTAQHPGAESIRAVQEAGAKALTESVRSALKEAAPLMTATVQETVQKQAQHTEGKYTAATQNRANSFAENVAAGAAKLGKNSEVGQKQTAGFAEHKTAPQRTAETRAQKTVEQSQLNPERLAKIAGNVESSQTQAQAAKRTQEIMRGRAAETMRGQRQIEDAEGSTEVTAEIMRRQSRAMNVEAETATTEHPESAVLDQPQETEFKAEVGHETGAVYSSDVEHEMSAGHESTAEYEEDAERIPALNGDRAFAETPENTASVLQQMAAPRYPEAELNFVHEEALTEGAEMPIPVAQHPSAESIRAMQEASAKALTESVRSALKEAAPLMTAVAQETVQKQVEQAVQAVRESQQKAVQSAPPANAKVQTADTAQGRTAPQMHQTTQPMHRQENAHQARQVTTAVPQRENSQQARQATPNIPPQSNTTVEDRVGKTANAANRDTVSASVPGKAQAQHTESKRTAMPHNAENISAESTVTGAAKTAEHGQVKSGMAENHVRQETLEEVLPAEPKENSAILTHETAEHPEAEQKQTADFTEYKTAPQRTVETPAQKTVEQSQLNLEERVEMSGNTELFQTQKQAAKQTREIIPERIPALNGDRAFAGTPENAASILQQMAAPRYPEAELNFVHEEALTEGAEMPIPAAQHPSAESIRAIQEASTKALTENLRSALKEAVPLMTATVQETVQKQAEQVVRTSQQKTAQSASPADAKAQRADATQGRITPQMHQAAQPMHQRENVYQARQVAPAIPQRENSQPTRQATPNIPPQSNTTVENRVGKTANAANRNTVSASALGKAQAQHAESKYTVATQNGANGFAENVAAGAAKLEKGSEAVQKRTTGFAEHKTAPQRTAETPTQKPVEQSQLNPKARAEMSGNAESIQIPAQTAKYAREIMRGRTAETMRGQLQTADAEGSTAATAEIMRSQSQAMNMEAEIAAAEHPESAVFAQPQNAERKTEIGHESVAEHETAAERIPALNGDRAFAAPPENAASVLQQMAAPRYPETELNFAQEEALTEGTETPIPTAQHPSAESIRAMQEAGAKALAESVRSALKEAAPLMTATAQETVQKQAEQVVRDAVTTVLTESPAQPGIPAQNRLTQKMTEAVNRSIDTALKQNAPQLQQTVQMQEKEKIRELHQSLRQEAVETLQQAAAESRSETTAMQKGGTPPSKQMARQESRTLRNTPDSPGVLDLDAAENAEGRLPPLPGGQTLPGQPAGQNAGQIAGIERVVELLRQNGYSSTPLEYRMEDAAPEAAAMQTLSTHQAGATAEKTLLWLGEKVAANAARELSRMQRTMLSQQNGTVHPGQISRQNQPGQPGNTGSIGYAADAQNMASAGRMSGNAGAPYTAGRMTAQPFHPTALHTASRPMGIPAEAQWKPGGQAAPAQMVNPAEMPQLMYQTGQSEGTEVPFAPVGSTKRALPQLGSSMEAQSAYPALSMEYSSPMSRMEQQLQSAMAQQMSAASRPMAMQTEAGQYMAGKAAPGGMTTLDQMSAPPVNDQIVWQNPYLRSAPADMTYRNKKKPAAEQPQPAPRPQAVRMSDAEIHRMADQVFRIVKDKIRQERRKMGL